MQGEGKFTPKAVGRFCLLFVLLAGPILRPMSTSGDDGQATSPQAPEFNGDFYADLVVGVPNEDIAGYYDAGNIHVLYGEWFGLLDTGNQSWDQGSPDIDGTREAYDEFGAALAVGDFNGDGFLDVAVGVPGEDVGTVDSAGAINVIYGGPGGLSATGNQYWTQNHHYVSEEAEIEDHFGAALAAGDFDGDGYDDLAVGVPYESIGAAGNAGAVHVFYGSAIGLYTGPGSHRQDQVWSQESTDILGNGAGAQDVFGSALAVGDFDGDSYEDLAVGVPGESSPGRPSLGGVNVIYGGPSGLSSDGNQFFQMDDGGSTPDDFDLFGWSLAAGDFNGDGYDELAVGVPYDEVGSPVAVDAGSVRVLQGSSTGLLGGGYGTTWHQNSAGIGSLAEEGDQFGEVLATGDFDGDGYDDLAIGVPHEDWNLSDSGIVQVLYGSSGFPGLEPPDQLWRGAMLGMPEVEGDGFGSALAAGDFGGYGLGYADLAVGVPYRDLGTPVVTNAGAVLIVYGCPERVGCLVQSWYQGLNDVEGEAEAGDHFGAALAAYPRSIHKVYLPIALRNLPIALRNR